jgi:type II secretory pathway component HofQ
MATIAATSSATPSLQSVLNKSRVEQARREADQAEAKAQTLRSEADTQERIAQEGQDKVRSLTAQGRQQDATYMSAIKSRSAVVPKQTQDFLERLYQATSQAFASKGNALKSQAHAAPVLNGIGQFTGRIVNLQA